VYPGIVNAPDIGPVRRQALTARRVGNAWLAIEARGTLSQRIHVLNQIHACIHLTGTPCPPP
jgi:hypothetical protein